MLSFQIDWEKVVSLTRKRVVVVERSQLVGLVSTVLDVRNFLVEREGQLGMEN